MPFASLFPILFYFGVSSCSLPLLSRFWFFTSFEVNGGRWWTWTEGEWVRMWCQRIVWFLIWSWMFGDCYRKQNIIKRSEMLTFWSWRIGNSLLRIFCNFTSFCEATKTLHEHHHSQLIISHPWPNIQMNPLPFIMQSCNLYFPLFLPIFSAALRCAICTDKKRERIQQIWNSLMHEIMNHLGFIF